MESWLACSFKSLTEEDEFTDCSIHVESKIFRCHKVILGVASEFFKRSFLSGFKESSTGEMVLTNVKADIFEMFRLYVYTYDRKTLESYSHADVLSLKECADMWMVEPLQKACNEIITNRLGRMKFSDLLLCFEFAHHVTDKNLIENTGIYMKQRQPLEAIPEDVYQLGSDVFREFIVLMSTMPEITRYRIVERYVAIHGFVLNEQESQKWEFKGLANKSNKQESDDYANPNPFKVEKLNLSSAEDGPPVSLDPRRKQINIEYVKSLLSLINFNRMTPKEFYDGPGKSKMMTFEEKFNALYSIIGSKNQNPNGFNSYHRR